MRLLVLLGTLLFLTSCTASRSTKVVPPKTFQYSFQGPSRVLTSPDVSKQLTSGRSGSTIKVRLDDNRLTTARLGHRYFSASGYECRKYTVQPAYEYTACRIGGKWYQASPIISKR